MTTTLKTLVATGCSSGLGFEAIKQLLTKQPPLSPSISLSTVLLGVRNTVSTTAAFASAGVLPSPTILPLELSDLSSVKRFAADTLERLGSQPLDYLLLNAANAYPVERKSKYGDWCEQYIVNHLSQHYLIHLLREKLLASKTRIVFVSSGAIRMVSDPDALESQLKGVPGPSFVENTYPHTKFTQLLNAHYWRRSLSPTCVVVAVSPGLVPTTGLTREANFNLPANSPDARSISVGATSILQALVRSDFPEDADRIFLTSWGEWWEVSDIAKTVNKDLQDKWSPPKEDIETMISI
ncbi:hypothetical protein MIND_00816900 [Mycena indigotica]|uniref:Short-chain dehydrogenase/reductase n=1 Tax=Mycena indigotica TaxID=2126181 RepID=A0A8H6SH41_9AGAR|nr:uncharacterized protein MIND_00816900 [Mycena indigotica]KAF7298695.1 hypothetical protein MIND_00816900 [Mycena indigotica]